jgi:hypothetical protein
MNRTFLLLTAVLGTSSLLLVDSAIKGAAILAVATCLAMLLWRDSAASRHLVWLVAIVAMLIVPVLSATLHAEAPAGAWKGELSTGETSGAAAADKPQPKDKKAQALFKKWQDSARINGKIPGGALGSLAIAAENFVKFNPTDKRAPKLAELLKRIDTSHDWTEADAVTLLDDVTAIYASLPSWALDLTRFSTAEVIRTGQPLPMVLANAPWGEAQPNGLRVA